ncbi:ulp1 protease family, C-terminal catalytic domain-containing protein [Tanacetum coccineum]
MLEEYMRKARLENPGDGKFIGLHEKYFNLFKDPISFDDDGNGNNVGDDFDGNGDDGDDEANDGDGNVNENDVNESEEGENTVENYGIMSSPEEFTQWLNKNVNLVGEACDSIATEYLHGDLFGDNSAAREALNEVVTPQIQPTQKRVVKPSSYVLSPYMNKKTNVVPKITKMEFIVGNSLFAMQGDKLENVFEAHFEKFVLYGIRLNLETLSPGLWLDANVIDCWGAILNYEERFRAADSKSRHFLDTYLFPPTGCLNITFESHEIQSESHEIQNESYEIHCESHEIKKDLMRLISESHLYGHPRHATVAKVKHTIPKAKWKTKENFYDCGIFTMLHMENFNGGPASDFDCGLPSEKMVEFAKEFDKKGPSEKISIIIDAIKNREERDRIDN